MTDKKVNYNWRVLFDTLLSIFKTALFKRIIVRLIGVSVGFKAWVISLVLEYAWDTIVEPMIEEGIRLGNFEIDVIRGKKRVRMMKKAKDENDKDKWIDAISDI